MLVIQRRFICNSSPNALLYIHPKNKPLEKPIIDRYTLKLLLYMMNYKYTGLMMGNNFLRGATSKGVHTCTGANCGDRSDCYDFLLPGGPATNSLALHYVALHRSEVPKEELDKIRRMKWIPFFRWLVFKK